MYLVTHQVLPGFEHVFPFELRQATIVIHDKSYKSLVSVNHS